MGLQSIDVDHIQVRLVARTLHGKQLDVGRMLQVRIAAELGREGSTRPSWKRRACRHRRLRWLRRARTSTRVLTAGQIPSRWAGPPAAPDASRAPWRLAAARSRRIPQTTLRTQVRRGRARIPEQFALAPCRDAGVERSDRQAGSDPPGRGRDSRADVNAMSTGPLSDRREVRLGVDVAQHEAGVRWPRRRTGRARRTATRRRPPGRARTGARGRAAAGTAGWRSAGRFRYRRLPTNVPPRPVATQIQWRWQRPTWPLRPERSHRTQPGPSRRSRIRRDHPAPEPTRAGHATGRPSSRQEKEPDPAHRPGHAPLASVNTPSARTAELDPFGPSHHEALRPGFVAEHRSRWRRRLRSSVRLIRNCLQ